MSPQEFGGYDRAFQTVKANPGRLTESILTKDTVDINTIAEGVDSSNALLR